jgi:tRNA pseudouridine synthase 10
VRKKPLAAVLESSKKILHEYDLCDYCLGRLFAKKLGLVSNKKLGEKIHKKLKIKTTKCYVCKNIFDNMPIYVAKMQEASSEYGFQTFLVGAKLKPSILDRDDHLRSQFKLRGMEGVKTNVTRQLAKQFARKTKKKGQQLEPDITFTIDFKAESCEVHSKPVFLSGRYTKSDRNTPQKQKPCPNCLGKGCSSCNYHGISEYDSVEGAMSEYFFEKFGATQVKITWIGGEDSTSLVLGSGRPFFAKLIGPKKRNLTLPKKIPLGKITVFSLRQIKKIPTMPVRFVSKTRLLITTEQPIQPESLLKLLQLNDTIAVYEKSGKRAEKSIYDVKYKVNSENSFYLSLVIDGGVPLKRLVSGEDVFPNVSDILENKSKCETFDFEQVKITN